MTATAKDPTTPAPTTPVPPMPAPASPAPARRARPAPHAVLMIPAALALLTGLAAGLVLAEVGPFRPVALAEAHGLLMTLGFVGTLVSLERAVALGHPVGFVAPVGLAGGALCSLAGPTSVATAPLLMIGAATLVGVYVALWRRQRDPAVAIEALGAVLALGAAVLWAGGVDVAGLLPWLAGFLILTIVGERLELARISVPARAGTLLVWLSGGYAVAVTAALLWPRAGTALLGLTTAGLAAWLAVHDVARRTVRSTGVTRFMGVSLLCAQAWLAVAAAIWLIVGPVQEGPAYDAVVHAVFLGFVMSMILAHAPVILPAVTRLRLRWTRVSYLPLVLLQASLVTRLWLGDALGSLWLYRIGTVGNVVAILAFLVVTVASIERSRSTS